MQIKYTISGAAEVALLNSNENLTLYEIHDYILENELFKFKEGADSLHILRTQINRQCANSNISDKRKKLLFYIDDHERYGLLDSLSELEALDYLSKEDYQYWLMRKSEILNTSSHKNLSVDNDLKERVITLENMLKNFHKLEDEADKARDAFENAKQSYEEDLNLHASRKYWGKKRFIHSKEMKKSFIWFSIVLLITTILISIVLLLFNPLPVQNMEGTIIQRVNFRSSAFFIFITTIGFWLSRIILKVGLSNLHLREEAREKETMIVTYLALMKDGGIDIKDRRVVLDAIFKSSSNGIIKDDSNVTVLDLVKVLKSK